MSTLSPVELGVLGPLQVRQFGLPVPIPGAKPRAILTMLGLYGGAVVPADTLVELLWGMNPPRTAAKALQTHISAVRRALGEGFVLTQGTGWTLNTADIDAVRYTTAARGGREAMAAGDSGQAVACFGEALKLWRGAPELPEGRRGATERTRWVEGHAALVEDRADALLATGRAAEIIGELEAAIADAPLRERRWGQLMLALYRAGRQGEALAAYQRARAMLADELGVDPGPDLRRLESKIVAQDISLELPVAQHLSAVTRAVTFLLTDIEGSTAAWETDAAAMGSALARHDEIVEQVVTFRGGRLIKTRGEGDATFSVFDRPSGAAAAAVELQEAIGREPWALAKPVRIRIALHTGEVEFRDGDYFGRAVNRAARLRSLAAGGQTLCSGATAELVIDSLADDVVLADLGTRQLKNLARPEHVFELRLENTGDLRAPVDDAPMERPDLPPVLVGHGSFVGRGRELERLWSAWQTTQAAGTCAALIAGEPGVGKTRLAGEWSRQALDQGGFVLYGRCDEDLGAPYQPFAEALRSLVPCLGTSRLRELRGEIASRGEHLALAPVEWFGPEQRLGTFRAEWLGVADIDADGRIAALVMLDADDFDAAFEELDARYLAGEARRHASIWSLVTQTYAAFNRHELSKTTPDWVNIDHRLGVGSAPGDMNPYVSAMWTVVPDVSTRIVAVHRLSNLGAVFTHTERGTSHEGFDAEWREVALLTFDGDAINRCELFDETDIDAAVARFDELDRRAQCPENAASRAGDLLRQHYAARDWEALADMLAADSLFDDRRHVVNSGRTNDRDVAVAQLRSTADAGTEKSASACMATRGERLALGRFRYSSADTGPERFYSEFLAVVEIDGDNRIVARTVFDSDDIEAAFAELDARYLAGEALAHVQTWSAIVNANASFNRREMPSTTPEWVTVDHRRGGMAFAPGAMAAYIRATWDVAPDVRNQIVVVHRLSDRGAVFTQAVHGTSQAGFNAGWRDVIVMMVGGDVITCCEVYEEDELGIALARFEELGRTTMPPLENDATRTWARIVDAFNRRDTDQMLAVTRPDGQLDDRRTGVRDFQDGSTRERVVQTLFEYPASWCLAIEHLAVRGSRLCLSRQMVRDTGEPDRPITIDCLTVMEVGDDGVAGALVNFDLADIDGAITELTARWIASGEVAHPEVTEAARLSNSAYDRHDWVAVGALERDAVYVNHRQLISAAAETIGDHWRSIRALASLIPDLRIVPADVLAHSADAIVSRVVVTGTNTEGSSIELPALILIVFDGDRVTRMESFDIDQRELALARFAELDRD